MEIISVKDLFIRPDEFNNKEVKVEGWIRTMRANNTFGFIELNDGTCFSNVQVVFEKEFLENFDEIAKCNIATGLSIEGIFVLTPDAKQPFEIKACSIVVEARSDGDYPLQKKRHTFEYLRSIAHLRPRSNSFSAVFRLRSVAAFAIHKFFNDRGYVYVHTPIITGSDCEGAGDMFRVSTLDMKNLPLDNKGNIDYKKDFFGKETNLTVSGQLNAEAFALAFKNVYTFGPTFRAENSNTARHASEFWMLEPEMAFCDLNCNMNVAEDLFKFIISYVMEKCPQEIDFFNQRIDKGLKERLNKILNSKFARCTYTEAIEQLQAADVKFEYPVSWGVDLQTEHERYLTEVIYEAPVFVTDYPKEIKAFYMRNNDDGKTVAAVDLLVPAVGEIIGGSQREERIDLLKEKMAQMDLSEKDYWWYLELRKYGGVKHSGFGLGFERLIMYLTGISNIRDVIPYPRAPRQADF